MSERLRPRAVSLEGFSDEDLRRRLEGRAEVLEVARSRDAALESVLKARGWKRKLRARPSLLPEWLKQEPEVSEALERTRRRAEGEGWPESTPVLVLVRELEARRGRLEALARRRLATLASVSGAPSLEMELRGLEARVRRKVSPTLAPGEVVLFEERQDGRMFSRRWPQEVLYLLFLILGPYALLAWGHLTDAVAGKLWLWLALALAPALLCLSRLGRVRLTNERLVWKPVLREPVEVPLSSISPGGVQLEEATRTVRIEGEVRARVPYLKRADILAMLLPVLSELPVRGAFRVGVRLADVVIYPAELREGSVCLQTGYAVLRPSGVSFIPDSDAAQALGAFTKGRKRLSVGLERVLEQLLGLPDAEFDACVARMVRDTGGQRWSVFDATFWPNTALSEELRILHGARALAGPMRSPKEVAEAERILRPWPRTPAFGAGG
ncbi:hypothetical protein ACLESD_15675 [Pyxidicoccus sp. 3LFB2]